MLSTPIEASAEQIGAFTALFGVTINVGDLLPATHTAWHYDGSLTTPPCSEGIRWHVLDTPIEASDTQIAAFAEIIGENARPTQPLGERTVE
jgi:carbonic anhydrase